LGSEKGKAAPRENNKPMENEEIVRVYLGESTTHLLSKKRKEKNPGEAGKNPNLSARESVRRTNS